MKNHKDFKLDELSVPVTPPVGETEVSEPNGETIILTVVLVVVMA